MSIHLTPYKVHGGMIQVKVLVTGDDGPEVVEPRGDRPMGIKTLRLNGYLRTTKANARGDRPMESTVLRLKRY